MGKIKRKEAGYWFKAPNNPIVLDKNEAMFVKCGPNVFRITAIPEAFKDGEPDIFLYQTEGYEL